jgi:hypothetical protein
LKINAKFRNSDILVSAFFNGQWEFVEFRCDFVEFCIVGPPYLIVDNTEAILLDFQMARIAGVVAMGNAAPRDPAGHADLFE